MITEEKFTEIIEDNEGVKWVGDNAFQGLQIIARYIDPAKHDLIQGAGHGVIWSVDVVKLIEAGITEEDVIALKKLNWMIEDGSSYLACFV